MQIRPKPCLKWPEDSNGTFREKERGLDTSIHGGVPFSKIYTALDGHQMMPKRQQEIGSDERLWLRAYATKGVNSSKSIHARGH